MTDVLFAELKSTKTVELPSAVIHRLLCHDQVHVTVPMDDKDPVVSRECSDHCTPYQMKMCISKTCAKRRVLRTPFVAGDVVSVLEDWQTFVSLDKVRSADIWSPLQTRGAGIAYAAGGGLSITKSEPRSVHIGERDDIAPFGQLRPAAEMPGWASRLTLEVTSVRVHRLHKIHEADAIAEGIQGIAGIDIDIDGFWWPGQAIRRYSERWELIYGESTWAANPWVVGLEANVIRKGDS